MKLLCWLGFHRWIVYETKWYMNKLPQSQWEEKPWARDGTLRASTLICTRCGSKKNVDERL